MYGLFLAFGEAGPGNNIGLVAAKAYPSNLRGRLYSMGAAIGIHILNFGARLQY
jgi:hypothetical protein